MAVKVLVSVCNQGWMHKSVSLALLRLQADPRYQTTIIMPTWRPYEHGLNRVVKDLLQPGNAYDYTDHDFWLNIDADNPPVNNPLDLVRYGEDVVGLLTPVWHDSVAGDQPYYFNALDVKQDGWCPTDLSNAPDDLVDVDAIGSGCMLIHRRVVEYLDKPLFMREYDADGLVERGHDYLFCQAVKAAGLRVCVHPRYVCRHYVETDLLSQIQAFQNMTPRKAAGRV